MDLREETYHPRLLALFLLGGPDQTSQYHPLNDHLFCAGHLVQGINSGHSHDTQQAGIPAAILQVKNSQPPV